jgi:hypothetical protein
MSLFCIQLLSKSLSKNPLMVLIDTLGRGFQFIVPSENVLPSCLGKRLWRAKVLDKRWSVDDSAQTRRAALDVGPDSCELISTRTPATGSEEASAAGLNYSAIVSI